MTAKVELEACPFCGGTDISVDQRIVGGVSASCNGCNSDGRICLTEAEAIAAWNTRTPCVTPALDTLAPHREFALKNLETFGLRTPRTPASVGDDAGLVERLLEFEGSDDLGNGDFKVTADAAATILRLIAERDELRAAIGDSDLVPQGEHAKALLGLSAARAAGKAAGIEEAAAVAKAAHHATGTGWTPDAIATAIRNLGGSTDE